MLGRAHRRFKFTKALGSAFSLGAAAAVAGLLGTMNCSQSSVGVDDSVGVGVNAEAVTLTDYSVLTSRNDMYRRGGQPFETVLTPAIVPNLRELAMYPAANALPADVPDVEITAQPLLFRGVSNGAPTDALVVVTSHTGAPTLRFLDAKSLLPIGTPPPLPGLSSGHNTVGGLAPGVMSTPVIDRAANVLYLVVATDSGGSTGFELMAFNISNLSAVTLLGSSRIGGPTEMFLPRCPGPPNSFEDFAPANAQGQLIQMQRPGLLHNIPAGGVAPGYVYIAFGSVGIENIRYNGWVFTYNGYKANSPTSLKMARQPFCTSRSMPGIGQPIGRGGIFQFGAGLAADDVGNVYFATGNGPTGPNDDGDSYIKLPPPVAGAPAASRYPDPNPNFLAANDLDLSSAGVVLLPTQQSSVFRLLGTGKQGLFAVLEASNMALVKTRVRAAWNQRTPMLGDINSMMRGDGEIACNAFACRTPDSGRPFGIPTNDVGLRTRACCPAGCTTDGACGPSGGNIVHGSMPHIHGTPAYFAASSTTGKLFWWGEKDYPRSVDWTFDTAAPANGTTLSSISDPTNRLSNDISDLAPTNWDLTNDEVFQNAAMPSGLGSVSSNGTTNAIFWANIPQGSGPNGLDNGHSQSGSSWLKAFDALTSPKPHLVQIDLGGQEKHGYPTIANGTVYVATTKRIKAFRADLVDLFWATSGMQLQHQRYNITRASFDPIEALNSGVMGSTPQPLAAGDGILEVFWRGGDNNLWHNWFNPTAGKWQTQAVLTSSTNLASDPLAIAPRVEAIDVFWKASDNHLWHAQYAPGSGWTGAASLGSGPLGSPPHPVAPGAGVEDVFWSGTDGNLWHNWYTPTTGWQSSPQNLTSLAAGNVGRLSSPPMPISPAPGEVDVFWKGFDNHLWHAQYNGTSWINFPQAAQSLGSGPLGSAPHPIAPGGGVKDVFWRGTDNNLWHTWYVPGTGWQATAQKLTTSASVVSEPYPTTLHNGAIDVFWLDGAGRTQHLGYVPGSGWATTPNTNGTASSGTSTPQPI